MANYDKAWQDIDGRWRGEDGQPLEREQVAELLKRREQPKKAEPIFPVAPVTPIEKAK